MRLGDGEDDEDGDDKDDDEEWQEGDELGSSSKACRRSSSGSKKVSKIDRVHAPLSTLEAAVEELEGILGCSFSADNREAIAERAAEFGHFMVAKDPYYAVLLIGLAVNFLTKDAPEPLRNAVDHRELTPVEFQGFIQLAVAQGSSKYTHSHLFRAAFPTPLQTSKTLTRRPTFYVGSRRHCVSEYVKYYLYARSLEVEEHNGDTAAAGEFQESSVIQQTADSFADYFLSSNDPCEIYSINILDGAYADFRLRSGAPSEAATATVSKAFQEISLMGSDNKSNKRLAFALRFESEFWGAFSRFQTTAKKSGERHLAIYFRQTFKSK